MQVTKPKSRLFVLIGGLPGSGKSTLAIALAAELELPLLAKDEIKEALMDAIGEPLTVAESQRLGRAAVLAMLRVARRCPGAVLDSTWFGYTEPLVRQLPEPVVEVRCHVPVALARERYQARMANRHVGHLDRQRTENELWGRTVRAARGRPAGCGQHVRRRGRIRARDRYRSGRGGRA